MQRFAIIGAADEARNDANHKHPFDPKVDVEKAKACARELGTALAQAGHGLIVYDAQFIEAEVVTAYIAAGPTAAKEGQPILVRQPHDPGMLPFREEEERPELFERIADSTGHWEVSFYRSLADADGLILIGGARSTLIAGQVAIGARIPVLALMRTGGAAATVWRTIAPGVDLPNANEHARMADDPKAGSGTRWMSVLAGQRRRRYAVETGPIKAHAIWAAVAFVVALVLAFWGLLLPAPKPSWSLLPLFASTLLAGVAGAAIRMVFERRYGSGPLVPPSMAVTVALGLMAGALAGMLYVVAQPGPLKIEDDAGLRLVALVTVVATIGGLTAEAVFRKLLGVDVTRTSGLGADDAGKP